MKGCIKDAERMFKLLTDENVGQNSPEKSQLIRNPTSSDLRSIFGDLSATGGVDTLTVFFAGHGSVRDGSYFLATQDTLHDRLSMTSLPVADLFMFVKEIKPRQVNILIDACEAAGLVHDLGTIIKGDVLGTHSSMGVSMLVSSASDRNAGEELDGGFVTSLVIQVLDGTIANHSRRSFLNLTEIGNLVWESGSTALSQQPSVWALNIFGETALCKNPTGFKSAEAKTEYIIQGFDVSELAAIGQDSGVIEPAAQMFLDLPQRFDPSTYRKLFQKVANAVDSDGALVEVAVGLCDSLRDRSRDGLDPFLSATISAAVLTNLLPALSNADDFEDQLLEMCGWFIDDVDRASLIIAKAAENKFWLLSKYGGGMLDLYFIPLRASMILGYIGSAKLLAEILGSTNSFHDHDLKIIRSISDNYTLNLTCMNDAQAAYLLPFFASCDTRNVSDVYETIRGAFYLDIFSSRGFIADYDLPPDQIIKYLIKKSRHESTGFEHVARPSSLLTLMLTEFIRKGDADVIRYDIRQFDSLNLNWYVPEKQMDCAREKIEGGRNFSAMIGHSLFTVADIEGYWSSEVGTFIRESQGVNSRWGQVNGLLAAIAYSDRTPWFLYR